MGRLAGKRWRSNWRTERWLVNGLVWPPKVLLVFSVPYTISWHLVVLAVHPNNTIPNEANEFLHITFSYYPGMLYIGRLLGGIAGGIRSVVAPSYISNALSLAF